MRAKRDATRRRERKGPRKMTMRAGWKDRPEAVLMMCSEPGCTSSRHYPALRDAERDGWMIGDRGTLFLGKCPDCYRELMQEANQEREDEINRALLWVESYR